MSKKSSTILYSKQSSADKKHLTNFLVKNKVCFEAPNNNQQNYTARIKVSKSKSISSTEKQNESFLRSAGKELLAASKQESTLLSEDLDDKDHIDNLTSQLMALISLTKRESTQNFSTNRSLDTNTLEDNNSSTLNTLNSSAKNSPNIFPTANSTEDTMHSSQLIRTPTLGALQNGDGYCQSFDISLSPQVLETNTEKTCENRIINEKQLHISNTDPSKTVQSPSFRYQEIQTFTPQTPVKNVLDIFCLSDIEEFQRIQAKLDEQVSENSDNEDNIEPNSVPAERIDSKGMNRCLTESHANYSEPEEINDSRLSMYNNKTCLTKISENSYSKSATKPSRNNTSYRKPLQTHSRKCSGGLVQPKSSRASPQRLVCNTERIRRTETTPSKAKMCLDSQRKDIQRSKENSQAKIKERSPVLVEICRSVIKDDKFSKIKPLKSPIKASKPTCDDLNRSNTFRDLNKSVNFGLMSSKDTLKHYQLLLKRTKLIKPK